MTGLRVTVDDGIAALVLDRPPLNVLNIALVEALDDAIAELQREPELRLIVLSGAGKAFSAGVDVQDHLGESLAPMLRAFSALALRILDSEVPTLSVVHGSALGGACELVALTDLSLVADDAKLGTPEIRLGVVPPIAAALFPRLVGAQRAGALVLTGATITGEEAARWGLVWRSVPKERLEAERDAVVAAFRASSASALRSARRTIRGAVARPLPEAISAAHEEQIVDIPLIKDAEEGLRAFLEKRAPVWTHR